MGYAAAKLFSERGAEVSACAMPGELASLDWMDSRISLKLVDLFSADHAELTALAEGCDTAVYALGPDDRILPDAPAYDFFKERLVDKCVSVLSAAKDAGVRRCVVLSSYFCYFDRREKGKLSRFHPYIRARSEQEKAVVALGEKGGFEVMIVEIPYVFGAPVGRKPIWKDARFYLISTAFPAYFSPRAGELPRWTSRASLRRSVRRRSTACTGSAIRSPRRIISFPS